jgi:hypothetical protein
MLWLGKGAETRPRARHSEAAAGHGEAHTPGERRDRESQEHSRQTESQEHEDTMIAADLDG